MFWRCKICPQRPKPDGFGQGSRLSPGIPGAAALAAPVTAAASLVIERTAKGRTRRQDIRPLLLRVEPGKHPDALSLRCLAGSAQNLRMDSFCSALHRYFGVEPAILEDAEQIREEIYILWEGALIPPLPLP